VTILPDNTAPHCLTVRLFGACDVQVNGQPLPPLRYRKDLWLLALLALHHDREVARDWLAVTFWPDAPESQARYYLRRSLSHLRQALGTEAVRLLSPTPRTLRLDISGAFCDVLAFDAALSRPRTEEEEEEEERLQQAVHLYRGPLLQECPEEWASVERNAREQSYLAALERLAALLQHRGEPAAAVRWLRQLVATDSYRERAYTALMQALADSGDRVVVQRKLSKAGAGSLDQVAVQMALAEGA